LIDPDLPGVVLADQVMLILANKPETLGQSLEILTRARVIDLSRMTGLPG